MNTNDNWTKKKKDLKKKNDQQEQSWRQVQKQKE